MELTDSHCHLQFDDYQDVRAVIEQAQAVGVNRLICVGTSLEDSQKAIDIAKTYKNVWPSVGEHPHGTDNFLANPDSKLSFDKLLNTSSIIAVGEIGLDYYKNYSSRENQIKALRMQIELALDKNLPFIFHLRDAWKDFWPVFDEYKGLRGVIHSFTGGPKQLEQALSRGLFVALNGIITYTKDQALLDAAKKAPLDKLMLETDAPFLTPEPYRGEICEPKHLRTTAEFLANLRGEPLERVAAATTENAIKLFWLE